MLYIVASPIGNLKDITYRAIEILNEVDLIVCENTYHSYILLNHYHISKPSLKLASYYSQKTIYRIIEQLKLGQKVAYLCNAGTPNISDPGAQLVEAALAENISVSPIPGPSALPTLWSVSGILPKQMVFYGFLHKKGNKDREPILHDLKTERAVCIFVSPYRLIHQIEYLLAFQLPITIIIGKELTKHFEFILKIDLDDALEKLKKITIKGEWVLIFYLKKLKINAT